MSMLDDDLDVFIAVCETHSFSKAAQKLSLTQSAVTKKIKKLEDRLGADLFDRSKRPIALTQEAEVLMHQALLARESLEKTVGEIREGAFLLPVFRVGTIESLAKSFLPSFITAVRQEASRVFAITGTSQFLINAVQNREIDFAFVSNVFSEMKGLSRRKIFEEQSILMMPVDFARAHPESWTWQEIQLCGLPYLQYIQKGGEGRLNDTYISLLHMDIPSRIEVDSSSTMMSLVARGAGWTIARALGILQNPEIAQKIALYPLPPPELSSRSDEPPHLVSRVADLSKQIFEREITPKLREIAPWLLEGIKIN